MEETGTAAWRWIRRVLLIAPAMIWSPCIGQSVIPVAPTQVVDVRALLRAHTLREDFSVSGVAQSNGRWAAFATFPTTKSSMIIAGNDIEPARFSDFVDGMADRIGIEPSGEIDLRMRYTSGGRDIEFLDSNLKAIGRRRYKNSTIEPISSQVGVFWADGLPVKSILRLGLGVSRSVGTLGNTDELPFDDRTPDYGTIAALSNGVDAPRWVRVKELAEEVAVFENNGSLLASNKMDLDAAYAAFGYPSPEHYPTVDAVRIAWIGVSLKGELYTGLSSVPFGKPLPIAVIDPLSGHLLRVLALVLPRSAERVEQYNPSGTCGIV